MHVFCTCILPNQLRPRRVTLGLSGDCIHVSNTVRAYLKMSPLPDTKNAGCACECWERFLRRHLQRKPLASDSGMHHGTCVSHGPLLHTEISQDYYSMCE